MRWTTSQRSSMRSVLCSFKIVQCSRTESVSRINLLQHESIDFGGESLEIGGSKHRFRGSNHSFGGSCPQGERRAPLRPDSRLGHCFCGKSTNLDIPIDRAFNA